MWTLPEAVSVGLGVVESGDAVSEAGDGAGAGSGSGAGAGAGAAS